MPETISPTRTPTRTEPSTPPDPERHFNPERLCPSQRKDAGDGARPL